MSSTVARFIEASDGDHATTLAGVVAAAANVIGVDVEFMIDGASVPPDREVAAVEIGEGLVSEAHLLPGAVREALLSPQARRGGGVHHTPFAVAETIVELAWPADEPKVVADPSTGGGVFLLAAAQRMAGTRAEVVDRLIGCDIDPLAVATTEAAIALWSGGVSPSPGAIRVADFLQDDPFAGLTPDLVVGNPPFLSQLRARTARGQGSRAGLSGRWPGIGGYVDEAVLFMVAATELVSPGGTVALVQPTSALSARDASTARAMLDELAPPVSFWWSRERVFSAAVDACAVVCRRRSSERSVKRSLGCPPKPVDDCPRPSSVSWSPLLAGMADLPEIRHNFESGDLLASLASTTAGFRDQYYGLRKAVVDDPGGSNRLITAGLIDPLSNRWGEATCRYDRREWKSPCVRLERIDAELRHWFGQRLRPKLLVATQTRLLEVVVDPDGTMIPSTPVVVVEPDDDDMIWHLAAALCAPATSARLVTSAAGSGLSRDAVRVSATALSEVALPVPGPEWDAAATAVKALHEAGGAAGHVDDLLAVAKLCDAAYGTEDPRLSEWWAARLPPRLVLAGPK